jgi:YD repeat-containing protein
MALPEPAPALAPLGAPLPTTHRVISYTYPSTLLRTGDSLYRLADAEYSSGEYYTYTYDAVGNRLSLTTGGGVVNYQYDAANRLTSVNGQAYTWDNNGNPSTSSGQACSQTACAATRMTTPTGSPRS